MKFPGCMQAPLGLGVVGVDITLSAAGSEILTHSQSFKQAI